MATGPLNYFIHPHVEVGGKPWTAVKRSYRFQEIAPKPKDG